MNGRCGHCRRPGMQDLGFIKAINGCLELMLGPMCDDCEQILIPKVWDFVNLHMKGDLN